MSQTDLNLAFQKAYDSLNTQQREAVDTIEGPVLVNAGPGTGKTQILALRIANILLQTDTDPGAILCLTYTENGAVEMRKRLLRIVGAAAYKIRIHTFHSFCNEIIQENLVYFGKLGLQPIGDLEAIDLYRKLIDGIPKDNPLKRFRGDVYYEQDRLQPLYSLMKKEAWTIEYLEERIDSYIKELPVKEGFFYTRKYKEFKAGDPKPVAIKEETDRMEMLRAAVRLYPTFNKLMEKAGRYDYDDMILWVLSAFEKHNNLLRDYQERFLYTLVDEFQDTSRSQNLLLQQLTAYWDVPNVFVVGDADQSIFSFQDANVENIIRFREKYGSELKQIDLINNYRSTQVILDTAHRLIQHNGLRTIAKENDHPLHASSSHLLDINIQPSLINYANPAQEAIDTVLQIESLIQEGVSGKEIAIIYRNHSQVAEIATLLEHKGIPVNMKKKVDLLQEPFIDNILEILLWIDKETTIPYSGDDLLFHLLHTSFFQVPAIEIAKLSILANERNRSAKQDAWSLRRVLNESTLPTSDLFTQLNGHSVKEVSNTLEKLLKDSTTITLQVLVEQVIQKAGVLSYIMSSTDKPWLVQALNAFFNFIKEETKREPDLKLHAFLDNVDKMRKEGLAIPLIKTTASDNGINLVTAHGSKGSEFAHVFIIGTTAKIWDDSNKRAGKNYKLPDNLVSQSNTATDLEESRRLFYVAVTRAKSHLYVSWFEKDGKEKEQVNSSFVAELLEGSELVVAKKEVAGELLDDYLLLQFRETAKPSIELIEEQYITEFLKRYTLSVTHLNNYLDCPLKFYYENLIKVPAAKNENMAFGSAIHYAVEQLFRKMRANDNVFPSKEELLSDFNFYMHTNRDAFTLEQYDRRMAYGEKILPAWYDHYIHQWNKIVVVEKGVRNVIVQQVPINGKLDKLEFNGKEVNVVDYKTGKYDNAKKKLAPPHDKEPNGGDYWRQAVFYKILLDNDTSNDWLAVSTEFDFIEPVNDEYKTAKLVITEADKATVTHQITDTWEKIQNREFHTGCGKADCDWCNFVKSNHLEVALHAPEEEEIDTEWQPGSEIL